MSVKVAKKLACYAVLLCLVYVMARVLFGLPGQFTFAIAKAFLQAGPEGWLVFLLWSLPAWAPVLMFVAIDHVRKKRSA